MSTAAEKPTQGVYTAQAALHQPRPAFNPALKDATGISQWVQVLSLVCSLAAAERSSATKHT